VEKYGMDGLSSQVDTSSGAITRVPGFKASGVACGLKASGDLDLALIVSDGPASAAGVFTQNAFKAAPVLFDAELLAHNAGNIRAVVANAGNANACTGRQGMRDARTMASLAAAEANLPQDSVLVMSTGIIGHPMPMEYVRAGIQAAAGSLSPQGGGDCARAILTTDLVAKEAFIQITMPDGGIVFIGGMTKGSGMIHPNLGRLTSQLDSGSALHATMLAVITTDAPVASEVLQQALETAVTTSFNRITVDGDTSTNDTVLVLASGTANTTVIDIDSPGYAPFLEGLATVCRSLAIQIARDGEGATKLVEITIKGAATVDQASVAAKTIATSPLVKTALFGHDPNWGRILAALGRSGIQIDVARVALWMGEFQLVAGGEPLVFDRQTASSYLSGQEVTVTVDLGLSAGEATVWTCDFSYRYVEINAEYHT
jgi:glutamate N-acetyltransferase/amino-acid N-acetyltransferase